MKSKLKKWVSRLSIVLYKKQNITTFLFYVFCLFLLLFCFCYKVEENCAVLVHKPQRLLLENASCYKKTLLYFACFLKLFFLLFFYVNILICFAFSQTFVFV